MRTALVSLLLSLIIPVDTVSQERLPAEEILRFFPIGDYEVIVHEETAAILASKQLETVEQYHRFDKDRKTAPFPKEFMNEAESITHARRVKIYIYIKDDSYMKSRKGRGGLMVMDVGGKAYAAEGVGQTLYVLRFIDPDAVLKKYLGSGVLAETGETVGGRAVYSSVRKDKRGQEHSMYLVRFETGEILAAGSRTILKGMVEAGRGEELFLLGDPAYLSFEEVLEYDGQSFTWGSYQLYRRAILKYAEKKGELTPEVEEQQISMEEHLSYDSAMVLELSDPVVERRIEIYSQEDTARKQLELRKGPLPAGVTLSGYSMAYRAAEQYSIDGNRLITTITYDADTVKKLDAAREQDKLEREQRQKEKEEKSDDGK